MKKYRWTILITVAVTLIPMLTGILLWHRLPDTIATNFGFDGTANDWSTKVFVVFGLPLSLIFVHLFCIFAVLNDPKKKNIDGKMMGLVFWIVPAVSLVCCLSIYGYALGIKVDVVLIVYLLVGILFIILGNYMHRIKQNYTVGIKLPWTLDSEENWNRTHRLASWLWVLGGIVCVVEGIVRVKAGSVIIIVALAMAVIPAAYSWALYRRGI